METSALNAAHAKERRAEALVRERKFEEAAKCHEQAAHLFSKIQIQVQPDLEDIRCPTVDKSTLNFDPLTRSSQLYIALESIQLQRDYHRKQAAFVRMKQAQYEEYKTTMEVQEKELSSKQAIGKNCAQGNTGNFVTVDRGEKFLHQAIDRAMEEQDSLLELILPPRNGSVPPKRPKDPAVVLEELRTVNGQLRSLIGTLLGQLEASQHQVKILTEQLRAASASEKEPLTSTNEDNSISLSPLPPLAPLEMPPFDFSTP